MTDTYSHEARELELYLVNTYDAYRAYYLPAARKIARRWRDGERDVLSEQRIMLRAVREAARSYRREYAGMFDPIIFTPDDIRQVAVTLRLALYDEFNTDPDNLSDSRWT